LTPGSKRFTTLVAYELIKRQKIFTSAIQLVETTITLVVSMIAPFKMSSQVVRKVFDNGLAQVLFLQLSILSKCYIKVF